MANEVKHRKKGSSSKNGNDAQRNAPSTGQQIQDEEPKKPMVGSTVSSQTPASLEVRTVLCLLCVAICGGLSWLVFEQFRSFSMLELKYQSLQTRSGALEEVEDKIKLIFGKLKETEEAVMTFKALDIAQRTEHLQRDISSLKAWSGAISKKREQLEGNLTTLQTAITKIETSTVAITKDVSMKINAVKTDVRRISGFESDINSLMESVDELETKLDKVEKTTVQSIGDSLAASIDRFNELKDAISRNSERVDLMKKRLGELRSNFSNNSEKLQDLESDRLKVIQAVHFANDLKPKVFTIRKDMSQVENTLNDLSLRIGRLARDLLGREKEIVLINDKLYNLTVMKSEILDLSHEIGSDLETS
ncbi:inhibitor of nuclear factor kappa-B kinase-interacting protein isoform X2 [Pelobates fuscus]|uniref:inhibitor of nuclear factor kappa-B kinase-interacting protein isoform X2 n=1 Tax=Pelobates fuscus TaxID=191477 RepID=UPI002FE4E261